MFLRTGRIIVSLLTFSKTLRKWDWLYKDLVEDTLYRSKRGVTNEPRNVAVYLIRRLRREALNEIGRRFKIEKYSSVSSIIERVKQQMRKDAGFKKRIDALCSTAIKSQRQT